MFYIKHTASDCHSIYNVLKSHLHLLHPHWKFLSLKNNFSPFVKSQAVCLANRFKNKQKAGLLTCADHEPLCHKVWKEGWLPVLSAGRDGESPHPTTDKPGRRWVSGAVRTLWSRRLTKPGASGSSLGKLILPERPHPNNWGSITYPTAGCEQQTPAGSPTSQALRAETSGLQRWAPPLLPALKADKPALLTISHYHSPVSIMIQLGILVHY